MSGWVQTVRKQQPHVCIRTLSGPTRSFSKFQVTSVGPLENQVMNLEWVVRSGASSLGAGRAYRGEAKKGCARACSPGTSQKA